MSLSDIDRDRVAKLAAELGKAFPALAVQIGVPDPNTVDIAINATPLGSSPDDPLPFDPQRLRSGTTVADVVMVPPQTALLDRAEDCGLHVLCGTKMLDYQLDDYGEFIGLVA